MALCHWALSCYRLPLEWASVTLAHALLLLVQAMLKQQQAAAARRRRRAAAPADSDGIDMGIRVVKEIPGKKPTAKDAVLIWDQWQNRASARVGVLSLCVGIDVYVVWLDELHESVCLKSRVCLESTRMVWECLRVFRAVVCEYDRQCMCSLYVCCVSARRQRSMR